MTYRFETPAPVYFDIPGKNPLAGGSWAFYERGTTTPKNTWSDPEKTILNSNPVPLDSSGRLNTNVWLDGEYTAVLKDSIGATQTAKDITSGFDESLVIPELEPGFLTNDGSNLLWQDIEQNLLPDPTGSTNQYPVTNGGGYVLTNVPEQPEAPDPEIVVDPTNKTFQAGVSTNTKKYLRQFGSNSAPPSGTYTTTKAVTFPITFLAAPIVQLTTSGGESQPGGPVLAYLQADASTTGFTAGFNVVEGDGDNPNIVNAVPFQWSADGFVEVVPEEDP